MTSNTVTRRGLSGAIAAAAVALTHPAHAAVKLGDDGLYTQDWYVESFLDLADDAAGAASRSKHFAVQWSQRGCPGCRTLHTIYFADPEIEGFIRSRFEILHLDMFGARETTDLDGEKITEKALATRYGVRTTPSFVFFARENNRSREVARMPGLLGKREFLAMFAYVTEGGYARTSFETWLAQRGAG